MSMNQQLGLASLVKDKLRQYFDLLDGQKPVSSLYQSIMREIERPLIELALEETQGNKLQAAILLGINRNTLSKKMQQLNMEV